MPLVYRPDALSAAQPTASNLESGFTGRIATPCDGQWTRPLGTLAAQCPLLMTTSTHLQVCYILGTVTIGPTLQCAGIRPSKLLIPLGDVDPIAHTYCKILSICPWKIWEDPQKLRPAVTTSSCANKTIIGTFIFNSTCAANSTIHTNNLRRCCF